MLRLLHQSRTQLQLPQLLATLQSGVLSQVAASGPWAAPAGTANISTTAALSVEAADTSPQAAARQGARELGLDAVPLGELRQMAYKALPDQNQSEDFTAIVDPPQMKKLKYQDIGGYHEMLTDLIQTTEVYDIPKAPMLDPGQWVDAHFKEAGLGFEPRTGFYNWRGWARANLPPGDYRLLLETDSVMTDDNTRSEFLKQAQHELARLWDWQHRRAALGLSPDLDPAAAAAARAAAAAAEHLIDESAEDQEEEEVSAAAAAAADWVEAAAAAAEDDLEEQQQQAEEASGSSSSDEEAVQQQQQPEDLAHKDIMELLKDEGVLESSESADDSSQSLDAAAAGAGSSSVSTPVWITAVEDVADRSKAPGNSKLERLLASGNSELQALLEQSRRRVDSKISYGEKSAKRNRYRDLLDVKLRVYKVVGHDDDLFLPTRDMGSKEVNMQLRDPTKTLPVDPNKVTRQAVAIAEAAKRAAEATSAFGLLAGSRGDIDGAEWTSMPLLDRTILHKEKLKQELARLDKKPKRKLPWEILALDDYTFDLRVRPPTQTLDLLTSYLEVRYADILLRKDAVQTLQRQLATHELSGTVSEVLESPPAALTAAKTLSPAEREGIVQALDDLLEKQQYEQYRDVVLQLYCDGLVSWGELQQCWAAAEAGQELAAAAAAPAAIADDREQLFKLLSGQQQLGSLTSSSSSAAVSSADLAAAKQLWEEAGSKLSGTWAAAAAAAAKASDSSSSSSTGGDSRQQADKWAEPVSFEEAQRTWQQLLQIAGLPDGPRFEQVLLASSSSSSNSQFIDQLQQQLQQLQEALARATGLDAAAAVQQAGSSSSSGEGVLAADDFDTLQRLCESPPSLESLLKQHWEQVARTELKQQIHWDGPAWQQLWELLDNLSYKYKQARRPLQRHDASAAGGSSVMDQQSDGSAGVDAAEVFQQYLKDAEGVPLSPPPYPGASRILRWEQTIVLGPTSGTQVTTPELKAKLQVSAVELQQETGISGQALQHILRIAGNRFDRKTGMLNISCDRFPTREENRRWCLEVLHRLLQEGQRRHPSPNFLLGSNSAVSPAAALA